MFAAMEPSPRSLILDLLSTLRRGAMPVRVLVTAGGLFGISENNLRVALARLLRAGLVERDERGRYRLGAAARPVNERVTAWPRVEERLRAWRGDWVAVLTGGLPRGHRAALRRAERALRLTGFRTLEPGLELRPDNLAGGVGALRETLLGLGLDPSLPVVRLAALDAARETRARGLWDGAGLRAAQREAREAVQTSAARLPGLAPEAAMVESFQIGGHALRTIVRDPLLPEALVPGDERRALVAAMQEYDRMGRESWRGFLAAHGVVQLRAPMDTRMAERPLAAAGGSR
jgi:phenylacetic acid degradation operon negative regulatory protein